MKLSIELPALRRSRTPDRYRSDGLYHPFRWWTSSEMETPLGGITRGDRITGGEDWRRMLLLQDPTTSTLITAALRTIAEAIANIEFVIVNRADRVMLNHPANLIFDNGHGVTRHEMAWAIVESLLVAGNSILIPQPDGTFYPADWRNVALPVSTALNRYEVHNRFASTVATYYPNQVAHLRYRRSIDGVNGLGLIPYAALGELATDSASQSYTLTLLRKMGVPGLVFTPDFSNDPNTLITDEDINSLEESLNGMYTGDGRGSSMATRRAWNIFEPRGVSNRGIDLHGVRQITEERILACLGVPPALISIGVGAEQVRVGRTLEQLQAAFATDTIQPLADHIAGQLTKEVLPYYDKSGRYRYKPDYRKSAMMQTYLAVPRQAQAAYLSGLITAGIITPAEAKAQLPEV